MRTSLLTVLTLTSLSFAQAVSVKVQQGDTLSRIAVRYGTTTQALERANPGTKPHALRVGSVLQLPTGAGQLWTVRTGDTLSRIAQRYGVTVTALLEANRPLNARSPLKVGQRLSLPNRAALHDSKSPVIRTASLRMPAGLPLQGRMTTPFKADHPGLDLAAPFGSSIRAVLAGRVVESYFDARTGWGWTVVLDHGNGMKTRYSHNSSNLVRTGTRVNRGDVIARVGSTGKSTGPHLDFRVYRGGQAVNPFSLL